MNDKNELSVNFSCNLAYNIKFTKEQVDGCIKIAFEKFDEYLLSSLYAIHRFNGVDKRLINKFKQEEDLIKEKFKNIHTLLYQVDNEGNDDCDTLGIIAYTMFQYAVEDYIKLNIETLIHNNPNMIKDTIVYVENMDDTNE